jgi:hypothetical protein
MSAEPGGINFKSLAQFIYSPDGVVKGLPVHENHSSVIGMLTGSFGLLFCGHTYFYRFRRMVIKKSIGVYTFHASLDGVSYSPKIFCRTE